MAPSKIISIKRGLEALKIWMKKHGIKCQNSLQSFFSYFFAKGLDAGWFTWQILMDDNSKN